MRLALRKYGGSGTSNSTRTAPPTFRKRRCTELWPCQTACSLRGFVRPHPSYTLFPPQARRFTRLFSTFNYWPLSPGCHGPFRCRRFLLAHPSFCVRESDCAASDIINRGFWPGRPGRAWVTTGKKRKSFADSPLWHGRRFGEWSDLRADAGFFYR